MNSSSLLKRNFLFLNHFSSFHLQVRIKPRQNKLEVDLALDTMSETYDRDAEEKLQIRTQVLLQRYETLGIEVLTPTFPLSDPHFIQESTHSKLRCWSTLWRSGERVDSNRPSLCCRRESKLSFCVLDIFSSI